MSAGEAKLDNRIVFYQQYRCRYMPVTICGPHAVGWDKS